MIGRFLCRLADLYMRASCTTPPACPRPAIALNLSVPSFSDSTMRSERECFGAFSERLHDLELHRFVGGRVEVQQILRSLGPAEAAEVAHGRDAHGLRCRLRDPHDGRSRRRERGLRQMKQGTDRRAGVLALEGDLAEDRDDFLGIGFHQSAKRLNPQIGIRVVGERGCIPGIRRRRCLERLWWR